MTTDPVIITEEYWANTPLSVVRRTGSIRVFNCVYTIVDKNGRTLFELSALAAKQGRAKAIEAGEPCDLVLNEWIPLYRKLGRERTLEIAERTADLKQAKTLAREKGWLK